MIELDELLAVRHAAERLSVSPTRIRQFLARGELAFISTANGRLMRPDDVEALKTKRAAQQAERANR